MKKHSVFLKRVIFAYIRSMRPYLFFLSGMAGFLGIVFSGVSLSWWRVTAVLSILFIGWGVNQVINDLLGLREDRINAPHRPLVTGELPVRFALGFSIFFFCLGGLVTYFLNPQALILFASVFLLNIIYEYSKRIPLLGNIVFGLLLAPCVYYGAMCLNNKGLDILKDRNLFLFSLGVFLVNITVAFFTYYKDYRGDNVTGNTTIIVYLTPNKAKYLNFLIGLLPFTVLIFLITSFRFNPEFILLTVLNLIIFEYTAFLFFRNPQGKETYYSLKWNFRGAVLFMTAFIALINPLLAGILYLFNFVIIGVLFDLHKDYQA